MKGVRPFHLRARDGAQIHGQMQGHGAETVLFLNSLASDLRMWDAVVNDLDHKQILRFDTRGHGNSDVGPSAYTIDLLVNDVLDVLDHTGVDKVTLCGLSLGGMVALGVALSASERVERLVLAHTAASFAPKSMWDERAAIALREGTQALADASVQRWFTADFAATHPAVVAKAREMIGKTAGAGYAGCAELLSTTDLSARLGEIEIPTTVIAGQFDQATPVARAQQISQSIPGATPIIHQTAHLGAMEYPTGFTEVLK